MDTRHFDVVLSESTFYKDFSPSSREALLSIAASKAFSKGDILFHEGNEGQGVYTLLSGTIQLYKTTLDGREIVIRTLQAGDTFGEVVLFERDDYPVTAVSLAKSEVLIVQRKTLLTLLEKESFRNDFMRMLMSKQRYLTERVRYLTSYDVEERFVRFLREQYGEREEIEVTFSKKQIAQAIAATPETLSRLLLRMKKDELLVWEGRSLRLSPDMWACYCD